MSGFLMFLAISLPIVGAFLSVQLAQHDSGCQSPLCKGSLLCGAGGAAHCTAVLSSGS